MTLIELLVATVLSMVVMLSALFATLEFSEKQEARITERVQANRGGRYAMTEMVENLHSACVGFDADAIQGPSTKPTSPLLELGPTDLWFISANGSPSSGKSVIEKVYEHDVHWGSTGKSSTGETLGTLTHLNSFESTSGSGPASKSGEVGIPHALETKNAKAKVIATNVIPQSLSGTNTIFQYYKYSSTPGEMVLVTSGIPTTATETRSPRSASASRPRRRPGTPKKGYGMAPFSDSVVLRRIPAETSSEAVNEPCT